MQTTNLKLAILRGILETADASVPYAYDWNISLTLPPGEWSIPFYFWQSVPFIDYNNVMLLYQGVAGAHPFDMSAGTSWGVSPAQLTAVSLKLTILRANTMDERLL